MSHLALNIYPCHVLKLFVNMIKCVDIIVESYKVETRVRHLGQKKFTFLA